MCESEPPGGHQHIFLEPVVQTKYDKYSTKQEKLKKKHHRIYIHCSSTIYIRPTPTIITTVEKFLTELSEPVHGRLSFS